MWKSLDEDRQSCSRGRSAAPEPGEPVHLREAEPRSSRRSRTPQQKAKREKSKRRIRDKCNKRRSRDKSQQPRSRDKSQRRRSRDKTAKEETSAASCPKPPQTAAEVEEKSSMKAKKTVKADPAEEHSPKHDKDDKSSSSSSSSDDSSSSGGEKGDHDNEEADKASPETEVKKEAACGKPQKTSAKASRGSSASYKNQAMAVAQLWEAQAKFLRSSLGK